MNIEESIYNDSIIIYINNEIIISFYMNSEFGFRKFEIEIL